MDKCKTDIGSFSNRVVIQALTQTTDNQGGYTNSWATYVSMWVSIRQKSQRERINSQQTESPAVFVFKGRFVSGITTKHRILFGSRVFNITRVNNIDERGLFVELEATEGVAT